MFDQEMSRRGWLQAAAAGTAALAAASGGTLRAAEGASVPAMLGGVPVRKAPFPGWPHFRDSDEQAVLPVLRSGVWSRAKVVEEAERRFARLMGAEHCLATCNGTNALFTSVYALGIGAGDEVITTPYTFVASVHPLLLAGALPVFADIDPETWQIDPAKIEAKITPATVAILPVHIIGGVCDMGRINAIARTHRLKVIEDACEAHGGQWKGSSVGTLGDLGCFSFQTGKSLTCGEGGAILGRDAELMDRCYSFHNLGRPQGSVVAERGQGYPLVGTKCRMAEYQAAILLAQMETFEAECRQRSDNAAYLTEKLAQIPGIVPRKDYPGVTRTAFYYYGFRYQKEPFDGLSRDKFIAALAAEGIEASAGLGVISGKPINREGCLEDAFRSKAYRRLYPADKLANYAAENECPHCDQLVEETVGFHQRMLLGPREDMDDIARAIAKIYDHRRRLGEAA
jgi:dTDP-4-amino-4,6-dideoxygalactose transaminase